MSHAERLSRFGSSGYVKVGYGESKLLPIIGRERAMINRLTKALHDHARRVGDYTGIRDTQRGNYFEVLLPDGRVARVTVELDRVEEHTDPPNGE